MQTSDFHMQVPQQGGPKQESGHRARAPLFLEGGRVRCAPAGARGNPVPPMGFQLVRIKQCWSCTVLQLVRLQQLSSLSSQTTPWRSEWHSCTCANHAVAMCICYSPRTGQPTPPHPDSFQITTDVHLDLYCRSHDYSHGCSRGDPHDDNCAPYPMSDDLPRGDLASPCRI